MLWRIPVFVLAVAALLAAMWGGLIRLAWELPPLRPGLAAAHAPLMVSGFLGTVIALERAVALGRPWTTVGPVAAGLGGLALVLGLPEPLAGALLLVGSLGLVASLVAIYRQRSTLDVAVMGLGALAWLVGNALWLAGLPIHVAVLWWAGFPLLTIAGERLELGRLVRLSRAAQATFVAAIALLLAALLVGVAAYAAGTRLAGAGLLLLAGWLLLKDVARRTVRQRGLTRFIAVCLLLGYAWLGVGGALALAFGGVTGGPPYDALLHAVFLGFVMGMILGHAPVIFPAIAGRPLVYTPVFYAPLVVLQASLLARVVGDLALILPARQWGGLLNVVALLLFLASTARALFWLRPAPPAAPARPSRRG